MDTEKLQLLVDNELSGKKRADFIKEIKADPKSKQELAHLMKIKEIGRSEIRMIVNTSKRKTKVNPIAKYSLASIRTAAFGNNQDSPVGLTNLPIKDSTLNDFLNEED